MSTEPYVPTVEVVRHAVTFPRERLGEPRPIDGAAFDRFIEKVKADALRETANDLAADIDKATTKTQRRHMQYAIAMLGGRATRIEHHARKLQEAINDDE